MDTLKIPEQLWHDVITCHEEGVKRWLHKRSRSYSTKTDQCLLAYELWLGDRAR